MRITSPFSGLKLNYNVAAAALKIFTAGKGTFSRRPVKIHPPASADNQVTQANMEASSKSTLSSSLFNILMGEVTMAKGPKQKRIAVEGVRLVDEAIKAGLELDKLFVCKGELSQEVNNFLKGEGKFQHRSQLKQQNYDIHRISLKLIQTWSSLTTPPGIIGIFKKPNVKDVIAKVNLSSDSIPLTIICDNIREPGNLGSILRSAASVGCKQVLLTSGCVDIWNMKVLRGACGAHFYVPIIESVLPQSFESFIKKEFGKQIGSTSAPAKMSDISISKIALLLADSNIVNPRIDVPLLPYTKVNYAEYQHLFLVIGGETEGLSTEIVSLTKELQKNSSIDSLRLTIPLAYNMDSLNAANACGVLSFEMRRQIMLTREI